MPHELLSTVSSTPNNRGLSPIIPSPALGGDKPADYMDTIEGQRIVSNLLAMMQSGAYA